MRGSQKFDLPIPVNGYAKDRPTQLFGLDSLITGQNMLLDIDSRNIGQVGLDIIPFRDSSEWE